MKRKSAGVESSDQKRLKIDNKHPPVQDSDDEVEEKVKVAKVKKQRKNKEGNPQQAVKDKKKKKRKKENKSVSAEHEKNEESDSGESDDCEINGNDEEDISQRLPGSSYGLEIMSNTAFKSLKGKVSKQTLDAISEMGFVHMTEIQARTLPSLLDGRDVLGAAKTGSGKTLAFLIPIVETMAKLKFQPKNGTGAIILSPVRELSMQTYQTLEQLCKYHNLTYGLIIGGTRRHSEAKMLVKGVNIVVATPGRLLDHLQNTQDFMFKNLQCLVIDEADRILEENFEKDVTSIISLIPKRRQTILFSATQTRKTEDLARISLKKDPVYIGVDDHKEKATVQGLKQGYIVCSSENRFLVLFSFLKRMKTKKVMVFFSSNNSVKFFAALLSHIDIPGVMAIYGKMKQAQRTEAFIRFSNAQAAILLCTDVAARGLDIPDVSWIVQFDPPDDCKEYIHRVGRTARGENGVGNALLFLRPEELRFINYLTKARVTAEEIHINWDKVSDIQSQLELVITKNRRLHKGANEACKSYVRAYYSHAHKDIFDIAQLDQGKSALSFGLKNAPYVDIHINRSGGKKQTGGGAAGRGSVGHNSKKGVHKARVFKQGKKADGQKFTRH